MKIVKIKNLKGRITGYRARRGQVTGDGELPKIAQAHLEQNIDAALDRLTMGTQILTWRDHRVLVIPTIYDWSYWIDAFETRYTVSGMQTMEDARTSAFYHLAQNLWNHDCQDDDAFCADIPISEPKQKEILSWIKWQRSYRAYREQGMSDTQAHAAASGFIAA